MAKTLSAKIGVSLSAVLANTLDIGGADYPIAYNPSNLFTNGTGANQANMAFTDERTIIASGNEDLDLAGGLNDAFGGAITFTAVKAILIVADAGNTNNVEVSPAASNGFDGPFGDPSDVLAIPPGGIALLTNPSAAGWPVTAGTGDLLNIANSGGSTSVTYKIIIVGTV